ncbi:hypothetical protein H4R18_003915 [Coemansia javaensis]|uniref:Uncharacterized protein n=1 Tax=Coemansia javaensis TaxID=2761396 RepID=A0A9W8LFL6_9FUNG|nr:hypothetical protein H4R18_003915 [Coemansia javaensis]
MAGPLGLEGDMLRSVDWDHILALTRERAPEFVPMIERAMEMCREAAGTGAALPTAAAAVATAAAAAAAALGSARDAAPKSPAGVLREIRAALGKERQGLADLDAFDQVCIELAGQTGRPEQRDVADERAGKYREFVERLERNKAELETLRSKYEQATAADASAKNPAIEALFAHCDGIHLEAQEAASEEAGKMLHATPHPHDHHRRNDFERLFATYKEAAKDEVSEHEARIDALCAKYQGMQSRVADAIARMGLPPLDPQP